MYTQFCEKYRRWARVTKATMRITHKPGDAIQVIGRAIRFISPTLLPVKSVLFRVNPKFCVNHIWGANRARFIHGGSRLVRLPPCQ